MKSHSQDTTPTFLSAHRITKSFEQRGELTHVLRDVTVQFEQGTTYAITGVSGSGKTTLLHILAGLDIPTSGSVYFNQCLLSQASAQQEEVLRYHLGIVFQQPHLIHELSALENVMSKGLVQGLTWQACRERAQELLAYVGLADRACFKPAALSGGQQQRVALARALFGQPRFLLADEPTGNLDEQTGDEVMMYLLACQKEWGMGIIMSTHAPKIVERMQHVFQLRDGKLV